MNPYRRRVQYYETDMMGITHHANYLHFMEEARIDFMNQLGFPYARMEAMDVFSPVKALSVDYRQPCTFDDELEIAVTGKSFNEVVLVIGYEMTNTKTGGTVCAATSEHCFLNREGHFVRLRRALPEFYEKLKELCP